METARCAVDVVAGVMPPEVQIEDTPDGPQPSGWVKARPEEELTRRFVITSKEWNDADDKEKGNLLMDLSGKATAYGAYLMQSPNRVNWVKIEWIWF